MTVAALTLALAATQANAAQASDSPPSIESQSSPTEAGVALEPGGVDVTGMIGDGVSTDPNDPEKVRPNAALYETLDEQADSGSFELPDIDPETVQDDHLFEDLDEQAGS
ncbi:hypothetical protein [Candidatus Poriferisodalis sp.]|uniref:hypothetical protein n=1 Tax=Candidatus Poriferisodalis sp. TaxID=3101277 RepID=UPI003B5A4062